MSLYELFKTIHVLAAVAWVGGAMFSQVLALRARVSGPTPMAQFASWMAYLGPRYFAPVSMVVLIAGIAMVIESGWDFADPWIVIGLVGFAGTFVTGMAYVSPASQKVATLLKERGPEDAETQGEIDRIFKISRIDLVVLVLIVIDMVVKPGV